MNQRLLAGTIGVLLLGAPMYWASVPPLSHMFLELGAVSILIMLCWQKSLWSDDRRPSSTIIVALVLLMLYPLFYLLPLPSGIWTYIPGTGRDIYEEAMAIWPNTFFGWRTLTISPVLTEAYSLAFLPPLAVFLGVLVLSEATRLKLAYLAVGMAVFQSLLGLMQYGASKDSFLCFGADICGSSAHGTYRNYDHLAGFLEMLLPISVGLIAVNMGKFGEIRRYRETWRTKLNFWISWQGHAVAFLTSGSIAVLLGLIFTRSRSGIMIIMLGIIICLIAFGRRLGKVNKTSNVIGTIVIIALGLALDIGLAPVLQRFSFIDPLHDTRMIIYSNTMEGIGRFLPIGSGPGTFPEVFRQFQPIELGESFINHAHNDYLEWVFEGGIVGLALIILLLVIYFYHWLQLISSKHHHSFRYIQFGAGIGLLLFMLHGLIDFNWHVPANALYAAFLAGIFLSKPEYISNGLGHAHGDHQEHEHADPESQRRFVLEKPTVPVRNPFDDTELT